MPKTSVMKNYIFSGNLLSKRAPICLLSGNKAVLHSPGKNASRIIATLQGPTLDYRHHLLTVR
ncbi:hypothetical protein LEMLEM_LOCUS1863 [Lemmus lemmus]